MAGGARRFQIAGTVVVDKIKVSAAAKKALQGLVIEINDKKLVRSLDNASTKINGLAEDFKKLGKIPVSTNISGGMQSMAKAVERTNKGLHDQRSLFAQVLNKAAAFRVSAIILNNVVTAVQRSFTAFVAYDKALRDINKIANLSDNALRDLGKSILGVAATYNIAAEDALKAFRTISQLGYNDVSTQLDIFSKSASISAASTLEIADSVKLLIAVSKQAGISLEEASVRIERLIALEDASAVDLKDLAEINSKAGTSIAQAFDDAIKGASLFAAVQERTQAGGAVVGTFAKTFISRIGGANKEVITVFRNLGIAISEVNGKLKDPLQLLTELKQAIGGLGEQEQESIIGKVFGVRQVELGKAALDSLGDAVLKNGRTFEIAAASSNVYFRQLQKVREEQKSYDAQLNKLKNQLFQFLADISTTTVEKLTNVFIQLTTVLRNLTVLLPTASKDMASLLVNFGLGAGAAFIVSKLFTSRVPKPEKMPVFKTPFNKVTGAESRFFGQYSEATQQLVYPSNRTRYGVEAEGKAGPELQKLLRNTYLTKEGAQKRASALAKQFEEEDIKFKVKSIDIGDMKVREILPQKSAFKSLTNLVPQASTMQREAPGFYRGQAAEPFIGEQGPRPSFRSPFPSPYAAPGAPAYSSFRRQVGTPSIGAFTKTIDVVKQGFKKLANNLDGFNAYTLTASFALTTLAEGTEKSTSLLGQFGNSVSRWAGLFIPFGLKFGLLGAAIGSSIFIFNKITETAKLLNHNLEATADALAKRGEAGAAAAVTEANVANRLQLQNLIQKSGQPVSEEAKGLAAVINDFVRETSNLKVSIISREGSDEELVKAVRESYFNFASSIEKGFPGARQALFEGGRDKALLGTQNFQSLISNIDVIESLNDALNEGKTPTQAFVDALIKLTPLEQKLVDVKRLEGALSQEEIDYRLELLKVNQELENNSFDILKAQVDLAHSFGDTADSIKSLETALKLVRIQTDINTKTDKEAFAQRKDNALKQYYTELANLDIQMQQNADDVRRLGLEYFNASKAENETRLAALKAAQARSEELKIQYAARVKRGPTQIEREIDLQQRATLREKETKGYLEELSIRGKINKLEMENASFELDIQNARKAFNLDIKDSLSNIFAAAGNVDKLKELDRVNESNLNKARLQLEAAKERLSLTEEADQREKERLKALIAGLDADIKTQGDKSKIAELTKLKNIFTAELNSTEISKEAKQGREDVIKAERNLTKVALDGIATRIEKEKEYWRETISAAGGLVDVAKDLRSATKELFQAKAGVGQSITSKIGEAANEIKARRGELSSALDELAGARRSLIDSVNASVETNLQYSLSLAKANIESQKILGVFFGLESEAEALQSAYNEVISSAIAAGASERQLAQLRLQAAQDQLAIFTELLNKQRSQAQQYFTSTGEDRIKFVQGLSAIQNIVAQFNGNIENFRNLSETELNQFGASIISLPQELRQNIQSALELLPDNVGIGGLSAAQIKEILEGGVFGKSQALGIESLSENIQKVADLTKQSVELDTEAQIDNKAAVAEASKAVEQAKEQVLIAKLQLIQAENDAIEIQHSIKEVNSTLKDEIGALRTSFEVELKNIQNRPITSQADAIQQNKDIAALISKFETDMAGIYSGLSSIISSIGPNNPFKVETANGLGLPRQANDILQPIINAFNGSINNLSNTLNQNLGQFKTSIDSLANFSDKLNELGSKFANLAQERLQATINIDNQTTVRVDGVQQLVDRLLQAVEEEGFAKDTDLTVLEKTLYQIISELFNQGLIDGRFAITGR